MSEAESLVATIKAAMKAAMKAREKARLSTIRLIQAEFKRVEVSEFPNLYSNFSYLLNPISSDSFLFHHR